jgi:phosphatidylglycerophosphatase A
LLWLIGFAAFRLIDITKPYPIRKIEKLKGGLGIMGDDVIAGAYANIILQLFLRISA